MKKDGLDWGYKETGRIEPGYDERGRIRFRLQLGMLTFSFF